MKKILFIIVCLMAMVVSVNAQNGWISTSFEADDLTEQEAYTSLIYTTDNGSVVLWDNNDKYFRLISYIGSFDTKVTQWSFRYIDIFKAIVGYYDTNDNCIKKSKCQFESGVNHSEAKNMKDTMAHNEGKNIIKFLKEEKGYIRIVAPLFNSHENFDIKVPCLNN